MKRTIYYLLLNRIIFIIILGIIAGLLIPANTDRFKSFIDFLMTFTNRWDGSNYIFIASHGYVTTGSEKFFIVFPPLYPLLIKAVSLITGNFIYSGFVISNLFFIAAMAAFYKLLRLDHSERFSFLVIILFSVFPTAYFFSVNYPESLFVFLLVCTFYFVRKDNYLLAGAFSGLATLTRPFGAALYVAIVISIILERKKIFQNLILLTIPYGLLISDYLLINIFLFGSPFAFLKLLGENWQKSFDFPWNGVLSSWKTGIRPQDSFNNKYFVGYAEAIASTLAWASVPFAIKKWGIKSVYTLYLTLSVILFTSTGFILSAPRYLLSIPPFFVILGDLVNKNRFTKYLWIPTSVALLLFVGYEFAWGHWAF